MICKLLRFFSIICIIISASAYRSLAQVKDPMAVDSSEAATATVDSSYDDSADTIVAQAFYKNDDDSILKWRKGRQFSYMAYLDSLLKKRKDLRQDTMNVNGGSVTKRSSSSSASDSNAPAGFLNAAPVKYFFWALAIFFIMFIIYRFFLKSNLFVREKKIRGVMVQEAPEMLNEFSAYNALINDAEKNNDLNLAIRYLYLQCLRRLAEKEVIVFMPDKTNRDYVRELAGKAFQPKFIQLTDNYEYAWYGKLVINKDAYQLIKERFSSFTKIV